MTPFLLDLAIFGIVAFCAWRGYKNGLVRGVFGIVCLIISLAIANAAAQAYSKDALPILMPFASGLVDSTLSDMEENDIRYQPLAHDHDIDDPEFGTAYMALRQIGLPEVAAVNLAKQVSESTDGSSPHNAFIDLLAEKLTSTLSYVAVFAIAFLIPAIVFAVIGNLIGFVFSLPGLKYVDMVSGAVLGFVKGAIITLTIGLVIRYFGVLILPTLERTRLLSALVTNNAVANMFGL